MWRGWRGACAEESALPFDLARGPLMRVRLLRLARRRTCCSLTLHHIVSDGWSMGVLVSRAGGALRGVRSGRGRRRCRRCRSSTPTTRSGNASWLRGEAARAQLAYWRGSSPDPPLLDLPTDRPRPPVPELSRRRAVVELSPTLTAALQAL